MVKINNQQLKPLSILVEKNLRPKSTRLDGVKNKLESFAGVPLDIYVLLLFTAQVEVFVVSAAIRSHKCQVQTHIIVQTTASVLRNDFI